MTEHAEDIVDDLREIILRIRDIEDSVERFQTATQVVDEVRDTVLVELAALRREAAVMARNKLINTTGMKHGEANRKLAELAGTSPQTIARMVNEQRQYGVDA